MQAGARGRTFTGQDLASNVALTCSLLCHKHCMQILSSYVPVHVPGPASTPLHDDLAIRGGLHDILMRGSIIGIWKDLGYSA